MAASNLTVVRVPAHIGRYKSIYHPHAKRANWG